MKKIVLASNNLGKVKEFDLLFASRGVSVIAQSEFDVASAEETGTTFVENAIIKARHAAKLTGLPAIADDSGLEVEALGGAPGVYSARYAGAEACEAGNIKKLLNALKDTPTSQRQAKFQCVLVFMRHAEDATPAICQGTWHGSILDTTVGTLGFGYDPVFFVPSHNCSAAQLSKNIKNQISHRAKALDNLLNKLADVEIS